VQRHRHHRFLDGDRFERRLGRRSHGFDDDGIGDDGIGGLLELPDEQAPTILSPSSTL